MNSNFEKALALYNEGKLQAAKDILDLILSGQKKSVDAIYLHAIIDFKLGDIQSALNFFGQSAQINPGHAESHYNLGLCHARLGNPAKAIEHYSRAIELKPEHTNSLNNLGAIYFEKRNFEEAERLYRQALEFEPNNNNAICNLGNIKLAQNKPDEAIECYNRAINTKPGEDIEFSFACAYNNIGFVKIEYGQLDEAFHYFDKAIETDPDYVEAYFNKARAYLLQGDFENGWEFYEWRIKRKDFGSRRFLKPRLANQDAAGKTILVYTEQGLGDAIQFIRYLPLLREKGCRIVFECNKILIPLFSGLDWFDAIIPQTTDAEPQAEYDYQIPLLSLPYYFKTNISTIPGGVPYVNVYNETVEKWGKIINADKNFKVGIVWAGNPGHIRDHDRSCKITDFLPVFNTNGVSVFILQKGEAAKQVKDILAPYTDMNRYGFDSEGTFYDIAAIIKNLDLVITVDTSIAHLAGALNKPVWTLVTYTPDWRWMLNRNDTPWYPSMKIFRQPEAGNWKAVFNNIKEELTKMISPNELKKIRDFSKAFDSFALQQKKERVFLGLTSGENFGWGVCSRYLKEELSKKLEVINLDENKAIVEKGSVDGTVFHALTDFNFFPMFNVKGARNYGYTFFENELNDTSVVNARRFDKIFAGSEWCREKMEAKGILNNETLIQGVDPELFYPIEESGESGLFKIFSGGKFELRKGQDLVLKAVKILQQKYADIVLINSWYNIWPATMRAMRYSDHINFELSGPNWHEQMRHICAINNINGDKILTLPLTPNNKMRELYKKTDIALFPNRCEGGTNLVLMEYMACGKPVIASFNSGHKDIITDDNSYPLRKMKEFKLFDNEKRLIADWEEPDIDEIVSLIEFAYNNRDAIKAKGKSAGEHMKKFTWEASANTLLNNIDL
jgi:tetratricopeptide (TPR) repeat protein